MTTPSLPAPRPYESPALVSNLLLAQLAVVTFALVVLALLSV